MIKIYLILFKNLRKYKERLLKIINFDVTGWNIKEHNPNWLNFTKPQTDLDKIYLYTQNPYTKHWYYTNTSIINVLSLQIEIISIIKFFIMFWLIKSTAWIYKWKKIYISLNATSKENS